MEAGIGIGDKAKTADLSAVPAHVPKLNLIGLSRAEMGAALRAFGLPESQIRMRVGQLWNAIYTRGLTDFASMTTLAKDMRTKLATGFVVARPEIVTEQKSVDGTRKWLLRLAPEPCA